jgi:dolichol kinase
MSDIEQDSINYRDEVIRKLIHLCSLSIPIIAAQIPKNVSVSILAAMTTLALVLDLGRHFNPAMGNFFNTFFGFMMRKHEVDRQKKNLNGATYVLLSALICLILFPPKIFSTAFSVLIISDTTAALIGRKFGRHKFLAKSLEGTVAFFVSALVVVMVAPKAQGYAIEYVIGVVAVAIGAIVENISFGWADDNFSIPISIGFFMWAAICGCCRIQLRY